MVPQRTQDEEVPDWKAVNEVLQGLVRQVKRLEQQVQTGAQLVRREKQPENGEAKLREQLADMQE